MFIALLPPQLFVVLATAMPFARSLLNEGVFHYCVGSAIAITFALLQLNEGVFHEIPAFGRTRLISIDAPECVLAIVQTASALLCPFLIMHADCTRPLWPPWSPLVPK